MSHQDHLDTSCYSRYMTVLLRNNFIALFFKFAKMWYALSVEGTVQEKTELHLSPRGSGDMLLDFAS